MMTIPEIKELLSKISNDGCIDYVEFVGKAPEIITDLIAQLEWVSVEELPEASGHYLCKMFDARDDYDDDWYEVVYFKKPYKAKGRWETSDFDQVDSWKLITPPIDEE